jgi:hypothetical protein
LNGIERERALVAGPATAGLYHCRNYALGLLADFVNYHVLISLTNSTHQ